MSRATVRAGLAAWLTSSITAIRTVYPALPRVMPADAFTAGLVGSPEGCVACITLAAEQEGRTAMGGATAGQKRVDYDVVIQLFYRRFVQQTVQVGELTVAADMAVVAMNSFDAIVEQVKARIRADRTASGSVWQWGEAELTGEYSDPYERGDAIECWGAIHTQATEFIVS